MKIKIEKRELSITIENGENETVLKLTLEEAKALRDALNKELDSDDDDEAKKQFNERDEILKLIEHWHLENKRNKDRFTPSVPAIPFSPEQYPRPFDIWY
jgi:hypothetical protein